MICLGGLFGGRYGCKGDLADLEEAFLASIQAVAIAVHVDIRLVLALTGLGLQLGNRYTVLGSVTGLDEGIRVTRRAILLSASPSHDSSKEALNPFHNLRYRYESLHALADIE